MGQACAWCPTGASLMRDCVREREGQRAGCKACFFPVGMLELFHLETLGKKKGPGQTSCLCLFSWTLCRVS